MDNIRHHSNDRGSELNLLDRFYDDVKLDMFHSPHLGVMVRVNYLYKSFKYDS